MPDSAAPFFNMPFLYLQHAFFFCSNFNMPDSAAPFFNMPFFIPSTCLFLSVAVSNKACWIHFTNTACWIYIANTACWMHCTNTACCIYTASWNIRIYSRLNCHIHIIQHVETSSHTTCWQSRTLPNQHVECICLPRSCTNHIALQHVFWNKIKSVFCAPFSKQEVGSWSWKLDLANFVPEGYKL